MKVLSPVFLTIKRTAVRDGVAAAVRATRTAFESSRLDSAEMCELMLALRSGAWPAPLGSPATTRSARL